MPKYLANHSVRLFEASLESLSLAISGLGMPQRNLLRVPATRYSPVIGLVGASAEQALSAILVQIKGEQALMSSDAQYKSARQVLHDIRGLLRSPVPRMSFLTSGLQDPSSHRDEIFKATELFSILFTERAAGLHAGIGPSRDVVLATVGRVHSFISLLAKSNRIRTYIDSIPQVPGRPLEAQVLVEDLAERYRRSDDVVDRATILRSLFLVLPETPAVEPEWLSAFDRAAVAPTEDDINVLLTTLQRATPVSLRRVNGDGQALPVIVRPNDPDALPIAPQHLRRSFASISDRWAAGVGLANGHLEQNTLNLPHDDLILELALLSADQLTQALERQTLTAHDVWPFVASALLQPGSGTPKPFWFLVSLVGEIGQLIALLRRASGASNQATFHRRIATTITDLAAFRDNRTLPNSSELARETRDAVVAAGNRLSSLLSLATRNRASDRAVSDDVIMVLAQVSDGSMGVGESYSGVVQGLSPAAAAYWARQMAESASDPGDKRFLIEILRDPLLIQAHTSARKALRLVDVLEFGPNINLD